MRLLPIAIALLVFAANTNAAEPLPEGVRAELDRRVNAESFSGVVLVARHGEVPYEVAHGDAVPCREGSGE
jgi:hypothetical protein